MQIKKLEISKGKPDFLVSIDIGYSSTGVAVYNFDTGEVSFMTPKVPKFNYKNLGIPEYILVSNKLIKTILKSIYSQFSLSSRPVSFSLEVPNIVGCYAPALSMLLNNYVLTLKTNPNINAIYLTHNRLGAFYLKSRKSTKKMISDLIQANFDLKPHNQHERDALLQLHTVLAISFGIILSDTMRSLEGSSEVILC